MVGARAPMQLYSVFYGLTQIAVEPFVRFEINQAVFIATRFTMTSTLRLALLLTRLKLALHRSRGAGTWPLGVRFKKR